MNGIWSRETILATIMRAVLGMAAFSFLVWRFEHPAFGLDIAVQVAIVGAAVAFAPLLVSHPPFSKRRSKHRMT